MATPNIKLVQALRKAADNLKDGSKYQWGHMGSCNCGHLAQELTGLSAAEIHKMALKTRQGDWADQVAEYCPNSGFAMDFVIDLLLESGLSISDLKNLERLADKKVLRALPDGRTYLERNSRVDAILYMEIWADLLEKELKPVTSIKQKKGILIQA